MIQFNDPSQTLYVCAGLAALVLGALLWWNIFRADASLGRRGALLLGVAWIVLGTFEYWIFGAHSALGRPDEYNVSIPWIYVGSSRVDLQACKLEYSIVSPK